MENRFLRNSRAPGVGALRESGSACLQEFHARKKPKVIPLPVLSLWVRNLFCHPGHAVTARGAKSRLEGGGDTQSACRRHLHPLEAGQWFVPMQISWKTEHQFYQERTGKTGLTTSLQLPK